jgi:hypothetical protein
MAVWCYLGFSFSVLVFVITVNTPALSLGGHLSSWKWVKQFQKKTKNYPPLYSLNVCLFPTAQKIKPLNRRPKLSRLSGITRACDCTFVATRSLVSPPSIRMRIVAALKFPDRRFLLICWSIPGQWSAFTPCTSIRP